MAIDWNCPQCSFPLKSANDRVGMTLACPKCKERIRIPVKRSAKAKNNDAWIVLAVVTVVGVCGVASIGYIATRPRPPRQSTQIEDQRYAEASAKNYVRNILKSPRSAEFGGEWIDLHDAKNHLWVVSGNVDAKNSFGVPLRDNYVVGMVVRPDSGLYLDRESPQCVFIKLGNEFKYVDIRKFDELISDAATQEKLVGGEIKNQMLLDTLREKKK